MNSDFTNPVGDPARPMNEEDAVDFVHNLSLSISSQLGRRIVGQQSTVDLILVALLSGGHCLLTGVPGLAKTLLVKSLAEAMALGFSRIQFTPDLMPSDITGTEVIQEDRATGRRDFTFVQGPIFGNLVLADEVNRTPPKTQGALLQAMQEGSVTVMGKTYRLDRPFHVLATQNPIEQEGTYPLPEALLDRFMLGVTMDYPSPEEEDRIVRLGRADTAPMEKVIDRGRLLEAQSLMDRVPVGDHVVQFVVRLVRATRPGKGALAFVNEFVSWGAGPRAAQNLMLCAKAFSLLSGKPSPQIEHVKAMALPVLRRRLVLNFRAESERAKVGALISQRRKEVG